MSKKKTQEEFEAEVKEKTNDEYIVCGKYINNRTKIMVYHKNCSSFKFVQPHHLLTGHGCKQCGIFKFSQSRIKSQTKFESEVYQLYNDEYTVLGKYTGDKDKIEVRHNKCGKSWLTTPNPFLKGHGCPFCQYKLSKGEVKIRDVLNKLGVTFVEQKRFDDLRGIKNGLLSYDFYLPDDNLLIEFQGAYHDGTAKRQTEDDFARQKEHDRRKAEYAKNHGIELLEIWYYEIKNIESILKSRLCIQSA